MSQVDGMTIKERKKIAFKKVIDDYNNFRGKAFKPTSIKFIDDLKRKSLINDDLYIKLQTCLNDYLDFILNVLSFSPRCKVLFDSDDLLYNDKQNIDISETFTGIDEVV